MKPGSLRLLGMRGVRDRFAYTFDKDEVDQEEAFWGTYENLERAGYIVYAYEMTEKGWTEI